VDEYQDTNVAQYLWLRLLAQSPASSRAVTPSPLAGEGGGERRETPGEGYPVTDAATNPSPASPLRGSAPSPRFAGRGHERPSSARGMRRSRVYPPLRRFKRRSLTAAAAGRRRCARWRGGPPAECA
jgi:hypothetical protein